MKTRQTKPGWGIVAVIGTAMLAAGAYLGGYMEEIKTNTSTTAQPATGERRAA